MNFRGYRDRLLFERRKPAADAYGGREQWETATEQWGRVAPLTGRELHIAQGVYAATTHAIYTRYTPAIQSNMRVKVDGIVYAIGHVLDLKNRHREIEVLCTVGAGNG